MSNQLVKKNPAEGYQNVFPKTWIDAIKDKESGVSLQEILQGFNMYFLSYNGSRALTRCKVPSILRKEGLWITYVLYDHTVVTEWYNSDQIDDNSWSMDSNWRVASNFLVGDVSVSADGYWVINGEKTEAKAQGEQGVTPLLRVGANNKLQVSYNAGKAWKDISDYIVPRFRWNQGTGTSAGTIQISMDLGKTWTNLSNEITNNLRISRYIGINESLPTSGVAEGTIYMKGPYYGEGDTSNANPIYRMWVYAWKDNTLAWQDNGEFTSISSGIVQERGNSTTEVMSQDAVTRELTKLEDGVSQLGQQVIYDVTANNADAKFASLSALLSSENLSTLIPVAVRCGGMSIRFVQSSDNKYAQYRLMADEFTTDTTQWGIADEGVYVENPEFVYVKTDREGRILWAIKADGSIYYGAGIPQQVIDYIEEELNEKVDKEDGKSLIDADYASSQSTIENPEYIQATLDSEDKVLEGTRADGTKVINLPIDTPSVFIEHVENSEWLSVTMDAEGKVLEGRKTDGTVVENCDVEYPNGIPSEIKKYVDNKQQISTIEICIPDIIDAVVDDTLQLFYHGMFKCINYKDYDINLSCDIGYRFPRYYQLTPSADNIGEHEFIVTIKDNDGNVLGTKTSKIVVKSATKPKNTTNVLFVGASSMNDGAEVAEFKRRLTMSGGTPAGLNYNNINIVGRKEEEYNNISVKQESSGGFTWTNYIYNDVQLTYFYVTDGTSINVNIGDIYSTNGHNFTIKELNPTSNYFGCEIDDQTVDVRYNAGTLTKISGQGNAEIAYNSARTSGNPFVNPNTGLVDISWYANEYCNNQIDVVFVQLLYNELNTYEVNFTTRLNQMQTFINQFRTAFPNVKFCVSTLWTPDPTGGLGRNYGATGWANEYGLRWSVLLWNNALQDYINEHNLGDYVFIWNCMNEFDSENNMQQGTAPVNMRNTKIEERGVNGVHPAESGKYQCSDAAFRVFINNICQ